MFLMNGRQVVLPKVEDINRMRQANPHLRNATDEQVAQYLQEQHDLARAKLIAERTGMLVIGTSALFMLFVLIVVVHFVIKYW